MLKKVAAPAKPQAAILLLLMSAVMVFEHWHTFDEPLDQDIAGYAVLSHEMLGGRKLYSDLWERKPPLLFAVFAGAERMTGYGRGEIFLLGSLTAIATMLCIHRAGGIFAAALWTLLCGDIWLAGDQPNAEVFVNLCLAAGFAMQVRGPPMHRFRRAILVGLLFAAATLFKQHVVVICAVLLIVPALKDRHRRVDAGIATGVIAAAWLLLFVYFSFAGRFAPFYSALFAQNAAYAGSLSANLLHSFRPQNLFSHPMCWTIAPVVLVLLWMAAGAKNRDGENWTLVTGYLISAWIVVALPGYFWAHYYQLLLPPVCIAGGWAAAGLLASPRWPVMLRYLAVGIIYTLTACWQFATYRLDPTDISREKYTSTDLPEQQALGRLLGQTLLPGETFWELGEENELYFEARRRIPTGLLYLEPLESGPERDAYAARMLADLQRSKPDMVIVNQRWIAVLPAHSGILDWISREYLPDNGRLSRLTYRVFLRRGSEMANRIAGAK